MFYPIASSQRLSIAVPANFTLFFMSMLGLALLRLLLAVHACGTPLLALNGSQLQFPPILVSSLYQC